jgi:CBS-domain-containing membrane protein
MKALTVEDIMTRDVELVRRDSDVHELEKLLLARKVHGVPVVDSEGVLVGVISQTDLLAWHFNTGIDGDGFYDAVEVSAHEEAGGAPLELSNIKSAPVEEIMSPVVHCVRPDRPLAIAASKMIEKRIHRLVVVDELLHVVGLVSAIDLLRALPGVHELLPPEHRLAVGSP